MVSLLVTMGLLACNGGDDTALPQNEWPGLSNTELLVRVSLDLRGIRPSQTEIEAVEADDDALDAAIEEYLQDERFGARVRDLFSYAFLTRVESYYPDGQDYGYRDDIGDFLNSIGEEVLRSVSTIAEEDLPWTDLVTAEWTMANEEIGSLWPLDYPEGATGWKKVSYTDGRPLAGILSTNSLYWRFTSTISNRNRGRANALSRMLLCNDYLAREVEFSRDVDLLDEEATLNAVKTVPGCLACHASLDPLASHFWGFQVLANAGVESKQSYHAERERWWELYTDIPPEYFGVPTYDLVELGQHMAADPRLVSCAVEQVYEGLMHRESSAEDTQALINHETKFRAGGKVLRDLYRSVLNSGEYRAEGDPEDARYAHRKLLRPEQLVSSVQDLTGYRYTRFDYDLFQAVSVGLRVLSGGADGETVMVPASEPNATMVLTHERLAESAGFFVVEHDSENRNSPRLFDVVDPSVEASESDARVQIESLFQRMLNQTPSEERVAELADLLSAVFVLNSDPQAAWAAVVSALIRDPEFLLY